MKYIVFAAAFAVLSPAAQAATCTLGNVSYTLTQGSQDAVQDQGCFAGNDTNTITNTTEVLGLTGWTLGDKTDDGVAYGDVSFGSFTLAPGYAWSVLNPLGYAHVMVTLKQSNSYAAFLLDGSTALSGNWLTKGPGKSVGSLSHASVYYTGAPTPTEPNPPAPVPLPAAAWLLAAGLGGLATVARKRR